jgi:hypothetical protein
MDSESIKEAMARHRREPEVSASTHLRRLIVDVGESISTRRKIYLDSRYWIFLRQASLGQPRRPQHSELLGLLRTAVQSGVALCPISDVAFLELMKHADQETKVETAKLIDELSTGIALLTEEMRVGTELAHTLTDIGAGSEVYPLAYLVWVRASYVLGFNYPGVPNWSAEVNLAAHKVTIDEFWCMPLEDLVISAKDVRRPPDPFEETAARLNTNARAYAHEIRSFEQAFLAEISGALTLFKGGIADIVEQVYEAKSGTAASLTAEERTEFEQRMLSMCVNMFRADRKKMAKRIPSLYINATCHAAARWDRQRNLDGHDLLDFHHAGAALGYCDAFFTENPLRVFLTLNHVALDKEYGCRVISAESEAIDYLRGLTMVP